MSDRGSMPSRLMTRILIVDDNPRVRSALRICLQMHRSWEMCSEAENGQVGVELAKQLKPDIGAYTPSQLGTPGDSGRGPAV
jgi:DNA-binding NarL/FixJ family response regulator